MKTLHKVIFVVVGLLAVNCRQEDIFYSNVMRSDVFYQAYEDRRYDFLWVFDNSASMTARRQYVKDNLQTFLNIMNSRKAVDYQMAMVTTDLFSHNGNLVAAPGTGQTVVKSETAANPVAEFAAIVDNVQDTATSFWEQGLEAAYQGVKNHKAEFSRNGVPLILVFLTDEEDWSCMDNCYGVEPENNPNWVPWPMSRYKDYFKGVKSAENSEVAVFNIIGVTNSDCMVASPGLKYKDLSDSLKNYGATGSICNSKLEESYENIARTIGDRGVKFALSRPASGLQISVYVNQVLVPFSPENYVYEQETNSIIFTGAVPASGSIIEVSYSELTN